MRRSNVGLWGALVVGTLAVGCADEKKPPLTPDGPEMTTPVGGNADGGPDMPAPPNASAPSMPAPPK